VKEGVPVSLSTNTFTEKTIDVPCPAEWAMTSSTQTGATDRVAFPCIHGAASTHIDSLAHTFFAGKMWNGYDASALVTMQKGAEKNSVMPMKGGIDLLGLLRADPRHAALPFILMSLFGAEHSQADWKHRPDAVALKPVRASDLTTLVCQVLAGTQPGRTLAPPALPANQTFRGHRVLLVEDNPVNQRVAQRLLQKLAAEVTIANHGAEALERLAESNYDAVLMDCQMPVMDGFTATRRIRELERQSGRAKRLPIIALTANVMSEDRENCIAAGMDAHLGKPIEPAQLILCLSRYLKSDLRPEVDMTALRELTGGDAEFERELLETFVSSGDQCLAEILAALRTGDFDTIGSRAHALKGASANIHASGLAAAASSLERAARANSGDEIEGLVRALTDKLQAVNAELRQTG